MVWERLMAIFASWLAVSLRVCPVWALIHHRVVGSEHLLMSQIMALTFFKCLVIHQSGCFYMAISHLSF